MNTKIIIGISLIVVLLIAMGVAARFNMKKKAEEEEAKNEKEVEVVVTAFDDETMPVMSVDTVKIKQPTEKVKGIETYMTEYYDVAELSKNIKLKVKYTTGGGWKNVSSLIFRRKHRDITKDTEATEEQRKGNAEHTIMLSAKKGENMVGTHTIETIYKLEGSEKETVLNSFTATVAEDLVNLKIDQLEPTVISTKPKLEGAPVAEVNNPDTGDIIKLSPDPKGFGFLNFIPKKEGFKLKRRSDNKFLKKNEDNTISWTDKIEDSKTLHLAFDPSSNRYKIGGDKNHNKNTLYLLNVENKKPIFKKRQDLTGTEDERTFFTINLAADEEQSTPPPPPAEQTTPPPEIAMMTGGPQ